VFDKTKLNLFKKFLEKAYPERDMDVQKIGKRFIMFQRDSIGCNDYILSGQYTYDQVLELNNMTGYSAGFGFCKEIGPVAFIGVPNPKCVQTSGYFMYEVQAYGQPINEDQYYFSQYTDEEAKQVSNYTVYGLGNPRILRGAAPVEKVKYFYDYRYMIRDEGIFKGTGLKSTDVLEMQIKLGETYDFYEARKFAYGSTGEFKGACGEDVPIQFAIVDEKQPVGILGLWMHYDNVMFKDVWAKDEDEPVNQSIRFISDEEAKKINDFKLYYFVPTHSFDTKKFVTEKIDRMLSGNFDFTMDGGVDYRLQSLPEKNTKVKVLSGQSNNV